MNDTAMTIVGNVVDVPKLRRTRTGHFVANFRVASTPRRFDRETNAWVDGDTLFVSVTCWRALGENVAESLLKGQPVVITGRYYQREYEQNETLHTAYELEATAVGHDLTRGVASFRKVSRPSLAPQVELDPEGRPADQSEHYLDLAGDSQGTEVDPDTGEIHEFVATG
jgi:single-strand DNA-binding protein